MSVATIIRRVQVEFDDRDGSWCDQDYILDFLSIANEDVENELEDLDLSYETNVVVLPAVPAGTTDLSGYQAEGQPLANMVEPTALEWRLVGDTDLNWRPIPSQDKVTDVLTPTPGQPSATEGIASYEWRGGIIIISPSSVDTDIRVRDEELPAVLNSDSTQYVKGMENVLVYKACIHIAADRGGGLAKKVPYFQGLYDNAFTAVSDKMVKQEQVTPRRAAGRRSQQGGPLWRAPMG